MALGKKSTPRHIDRELVGGLECLINGNWHSFLKNDGFSEELTGRWGEFTGQRVEFLLTSVKTNRVATLAYFRRFLLSRAHEQSGRNLMSDSPYLTGRLRTRAISGLPLPTSATLQPMT